MPARKITFIIEQAPEGGYSARAVGESIITQAETETELHERIQEAVRCHLASQKNLPDFVEFLRQSPLCGADIEITRLRN